MSASSSLLEAYRQPIKKIVTRGELLEAQAVAESAGYQLVETDGKGEACGSFQTPSAEQLSALTHLPIGMLQLASASSSMGAKGGKKTKKRGKNAPLAKEGETISKCFNIVAGRPIPRFVSLENQITVTLFNDQNTVLTTTVGGPTTFAQYYTLASFGGISSYIGVFDQYRFEQLEVWLEPTAPQGTTVFGNLITAVDLDDANAPTSTLGNKAGAIVGEGSSGRYHRWKPHVAIAEFSGSFASYGNFPATWIDSASQNVQHYGFKAYALATPVAITYNVSYRAVLSFRAAGL